MDTVLYHRNCPDGFCAAYLCWCQFPRAKFIGVNYGEQPPDVKGKDVWIVDFSYPKDTLLQMKSDAAMLRVMDHHKTAEAELKGLDFCTFDLGKSGARLTYEALRVHNRRAEFLVDYTEDRDLWQWKLPYSREVSAALVSYDMDFETWHKLNVSRLATEGAAILRYQNQLLKRIVANATDGQLDGHKIKIINSPVFQSELGSILAQGNPFSLVWWTDSKFKIRNSLRSTDEGIDVSEIAKKHGGGGHRNAAGF